MFYEIQNKRLGVGVEEDKVIFYVGRNAKENIEIIEKSDPEDYWFHVSGSSSAHVVVTIPSHIDKKEKGKILKRGALLAKQHSTSKSIKNVMIVYTKIKNVTQDPNSPLGTVHICNSNHMIV
jgi:predicted ribosome quality control (RQC) complex YloA/Tae2 family protein